ncbi:hypothetical protein EU545_02840 [Candidatus Thorarchaeota archaeon]|nr:MAG: hypothetical protein EU545_02840 [Candidatus Thorarchaeota archaeon]
MPDDEREVAKKVLGNLEKLERGRGGKCQGCGHESADADFFECEFCGKPLCTYCHNMTNDFEFICRECIKARNMTAADVQFESDGAGRPFF